MQMREGSTIPDEVGILQPPVDNTSTPSVTATDSTRRVFVAWLDPCGSAFCDALSSWMRLVLPGIEVAIGPDVRADARWEITLPRSLRGAAAALICVVGDQVASSWLHVQLGACFRALGTDKPVVPVLLDVPDAALASSPLGLFQAVRPSKEDFRRLVRDLCRALPDGELEYCVLERFESTCADLLSDLDSIPGTAAHSFQIVLVLPDRILPVPNSAPHQDEAWTSVMSRTTALQTIPGIGLVPFESSDLECLDLAREEWMRAPRLVSRLTTRNVALVHQAFSSRYQREAKAIAKVVKSQVAKRDGLPLLSG